MKENLIDKPMKKILIGMLLLIICSLQATAQTDYYYYYGGQKMPLNLNENKVVVSIPKEREEISERVLLNAQVFDTIRDKELDIYVISRSDFESLISMDFWKEDSKSVIITSCYYTEKGVEVYESPHLDVRLKKEEDTDLLTSYAELYKLRIIRNLSFMPLWYILSVTPDSEKSPTVCAAELQESGFFEYAVPDLVSPTIPDGIHAQGITTTTPEESSRIFDLQGRRLNGKPTKGVYIEDGRKKTK